MSRDSNGMALASLSPGRLMAALVGATCQLFFHMSLPPRRLVRKPIRVPCCIFRSSWAGAFQNIRKRVQDVGCWEVASPCGHRLDCRCGQLGLGGKIIHHGGFVGGSRSAAGPVGWSSAQLVVASVWQAGGSLNLMLCDKFRL